MDAKIQANVTIANPSLGFNLGMGFFLPANKSPKNRVINMDTKKAIASP